MQSRWPQVVIVLLLVLVVGLPFLLRPSEASLGDTDGKLVILTPHNEQIRGEFARAYNADRVARGLKPVEFDWRVGGTTELARGVSAQYQALIKRGRADDGIGADLFWGGGEYDHDQLAKGHDADGDGPGEAVPFSIPFTIDDALLAEAFPEPELGGIPLYHPERRWIGVALSSFGIVYSRDRLQRMDHPEPTRWTDLGDPALFGEIALADPNHSGSITAAYEAILKRTGWTPGWHTLRRCFANTRFFTSSASRVPMDVATGDAVAGMCIDFYGRFQVGAMPDDATDGGPRVGYNDPAVDAPFGRVSLTATGPDPISLMRGGTNTDLANDFAAWLISREAQHLWQLQLGQPGGPTEYELRRQPIRRDVYADKAGWTDPDVDPFATASPVPPNSPSYFSLIRGLTRAMAIDNHAKLRAAWQAIQRTPDDHPNKPEMLRLFDAMPPELTEAWPEGLDADHLLAAMNPAFVDAYDADPGTPPPGMQDAHAVTVHLAALNDQLRAAYPRGERDAKELTWTLFFRDNYDRILDLAD